MAKKSATPRSARGKAIVQILDSQGLGISAAARKGCVSLATLYNVIHHEPPPKVSGETVAKLTGNLAIPVELVCPALAKSPG